MREKKLHFSFYDVGAYDGETEHRIMCSFYSLIDGKVHIGQSQLMPASEWPAFRLAIENNGWAHRDHSYAMPRMLD